MTFLIKLTFQEYILNYKILSRQCERLYIYMFIILIFIKEGRKIPEGELIS